MLTHERGVCGWDAAERGVMEALTIIAQQNAESGAAQPHRLFEHRVEHRGEVAGRGVDDLQYLAGSGLLLQCFPRLGQQPRILHRDDRLCGEILQQSDLLVRKRVNDTAEDVDVTEKLVALAQRHRQ